MKRFTLSIAVCGLMSAAICGATQAAPITPLPPVIAGGADAASLTPVHYYRHRHYRNHGHGTAGYWNYYRVDWPGRGNNEQSTR